MIVDNQVSAASAAGGGMYIEGSSPQLFHTTMAYNRGGDGSGIYVIDDGWGVYSVPVFTNTILFGHTLGIIVAAENEVILDATLWGPQETIGLPYWGGAGEVTHTRDVWGDVAFIEAYHIITGSAALDAGVVSSVGHDIDGQPRPYQAPDLGADEFWPPGEIKFIYLPLIMLNMS